MALRSLELRKKIDEARQAMAKIEKRQASFLQRETVLTAKINEATEEDKPAIEAEVEAFNAEKAEAEETAKSLRESIESMENELNDIENAEPSNCDGTKEREVKRMSIELRDSAEYGKAFINYFKTGKLDEVRAVLSEAVEGGIVPIPTKLETEIKNAWENCQIMNLVKQTTFSGNVKVGFELSATGAVVHVEGTDAPAEEQLVWGSVELKAESIKKWITVSDEAIDNTTINTLQEIYKEIAQRIVEKAEDIAISKITASPAASTATACGVPQYKAATIAEDTMVKAVALLSGKARNLHVAMNRQTYAEFVSVALKAKYAVDVFDGLKDRVVYTDALKPFSAAGTGDTYMIVGDFNYGFQANFPGGHKITLKVDDLSLAEKDLVKIVGREFVGMGVVAPKAFVNVVK